MTDTLNRCVALVPPGTGGGSDPTTDLRALWSATGTLLVSDTNHLATENPLRTLYTNRGAVGTKSLYAPAFDAYTAAPAPEQINWEPPIDPTGGRTGKFSLHLGSHALHRSGDGLRWPKVVCKFKVLAPSTYVVGYVLVVARGRNGWPSNTCDYDRGVTSSTSYTDVTLTVQLRDEDVANETVELAPGYTASGPDATPETATVNIVNVWLGAYCSSNSSAHVGSISGVSCYLVDP